MAKIKLVSEYLDMGTPPCQHCSCTKSIKYGLKPCPYLDKPFLAKVQKKKIKELQAGKYYFTDFSMVYILNHLFERIEEDIKVELYFL